MDVAFSSSKPKKKTKPSLLPALLLLPAVVTVSWLAFSHSSLLLYSFYEPPVAKILSGGEEPNAFPASSSSSPVWQRPPLHVNPTRLNSTRANANSSAEEAMLQKADDRVRSSELQDPYHNWELFRMDFEEMLQNLKIFVYPDVRNKSAPFSSVFLPHPNPFDPKLGNYFSEHMFKISLIQSSFLTSNPADALFFFMPFSVNVMRNDRRVHSEASIAEFVAQYTLKISREFEFWNASRGSDHFYVCCHSIGREAASKHRQLFNNAIQLSCSSSYFQRLYVAHKDAGLPQIWPRPPEKVLNPPHARKRLVFFAGRAKNSLVRQELIARWANDTSMDIFAGNPPFPYEEGFRRSRYCLHVKGYEVNTARISDAMHYGCIPVIISNYYDLPFANVLDWSKFSIIVSHGDISLLKQILLSISRPVYSNMYHNLCQVRKHFQWHGAPGGYDAFHMTLYQLWCCKVQTAVWQYT